MEISISVGTGVGAETGAGVGVETGAGVGVGAGVDSVVSFPLLLPLAELSDTEVSDGSAGMLVVSLSIGSVGAGVSSDELPLAVSEFGFLVSV